VPLRQAPTHTFSIAGRVLFLLLVNDRKKMFLLLVNDFSRFMWIVLLPSKDGAPEAIKHVIAEDEAATGKKINCLHTNRGTN
jgi:hypothetical protein